MPFMSRPVPLLLCTSLATEPRFFCQYHLGSFEALHGRLPDLCTRLAAIYEKDQRVIVHCYACGSTDCKAPLYVTSDHQNCSIHLPTGQFYVERPGQRLVGSQEVMVRRLDTPLGELPGPMLVKIDVQGAELEVLEGLGDKLEQVAAIIVDAPFEHAYEGASSFDDIYRFLTSRRFEYCGALGQLTSRRTGHVRQEDSIYLRQSLP